MRFLLLALLLAMPLRANPLGPQSTLVLSVETCDLTQLQTMVGEADRLLRLNSSGRSWLQPHVVPVPYHPRRPLADYRGPTGLRALRDEALSGSVWPVQPRFRRVVIVLPSQADDPSLGTVGYELVHCAQDEFYASTAWVQARGDGLEWGRTLLHELGHNFGFQHREGQGWGLFFPAVDRASVGWLDAVGGRP